MNVLGSTRVLGVVGRPVTHSVSPVVHNAAIRALDIDYIYVAFQPRPENLAGAVEGIRALEIAGVNVTIPYKERVIEFLDEVDDDALRIGSVNTIINIDGRLRGATTDGAGFVESAEAEWGAIEGSRVLILGAGGSAKAVANALADKGCHVTVANRTAERAVDLVEGLKSRGCADARAVGIEREVLTDEIRKSDLLVNTTSVGMHPDVDGIPLPPDLLRPDILVYDLVYNPLETRLVSEARAKGARAMNGLKMLVRQGAISFEMWTGLEPPIDVMEEAALEMLLA